MQLKTYSESTAAQIPRSQGIYAFYLDLVSPAKLGLLGRGPWGPSQVERAREILISRVEQQIRILRTIKLKGTIVDAEKSAHLSLRLQIDAIEHPSETILREVSALSLELIPAYIRLLRQSALMMQPIYVGITKEQTLFDRYRQHHRDHMYTTENSCFGTRLREVGVDWDDVIFVCIKFEQGQGDLAMLQILERHFQMLAKPVLSFA